MSDLLRPCVDCGELSPEARCPDHRPAQTPKKEPNTTRAGYGWRWQKLSRRARAAQPFCSDCGTGDDLTTDHSPQAWEIHEQGKAIPLELVDVVCMSCNIRRGAARGDRITWGGGVSRPLPGPLG